MRRKSTLYLIVLLSLVSCGKDALTLKGQEEFYDLVGGYYQLREATTDVPIDLNQDGAPHTDLYKEVVYCNGSYLLNSFSCVFEHNSTSSEIAFDVPTSEYQGPNEGMDNCLRDVRLYYDYKVNAQTSEVLLIPSDQWDSFATLFHAEILKVDWKNDRAYFTLRKRFLLSSGERKWVMLYLEYEKLVEVY